jgi:hypothetical protein
MERAAGVAPVQGSDQPLRAEQQLLPADAQVHWGAVGRLKQLDVHEQVEQVGVVPVGDCRRQVLVERLGTDELGVEEEGVLVPQVAEDAQARQVEVVVLAGQAAVLLVGVPLAELAAGGEQPLVAEVDTVQAVEEVVTLVAGPVHEPPVGVEEGEGHQAEARVAASGSRL